MKNILYILVVLHGGCFSQQYQYESYLINFDDTTETGRIVIDTNSNPENCWQVGIPGKSVLSEAHSHPNVIITDTTESYPINNTSEFTILHVVGIGLSQNRRAELSGYYKVDSDSLQDFGKIVFSPDNGTTWIDIIHDSVDQFLVWNTQKPVLTGKSDWTYFWVNLTGLEFNFNEGDTVLYRFSFTSDNIQNNRDGLMYDDLMFEDWFEGIFSIEPDDFKSIVFPNPGFRWITIEFENKHFQGVDIDIFDGVGKLVYKERNINTGKIDIDFSNHPKGTYFYKLMDQNSHHTGCGKFIMD